MENRTAVRVHNGRRSSLGIEVSLRLIGSFAIMTAGSVQEYQA